MRRFTDYKTIIEALKTSEALELGGDEGDETIKRKVPLPVGALSRDQETFEPKVVFDKSLKTSMYAVSNSVLSMRDVFADNRTEGIRRGDPHHPD